MNLVAYCADVGSVAAGSFGWASHPSREGAAPTDIRALAEAVAEDLNAARRVALGFECPLFVPLADDPAELLSAREGDGSRPWSAGAGPTVLAVGLVEAAWI